MGRGGLHGGPYDLDEDGGELVPLFIVRARGRSERVRTKLEQSPTVRAAAIVADRWNMDIIDVLAEPNPLHRSIRIAGHNLLTREEARAYGRPPPS